MLLLQIRPGPSQHSDILKQSLLCLLRGEGKDEFWELWYSEIPGYRRLGKEVFLLMAKSCTIGNRGSCVLGTTSLNTGKPWAPLDEVYRYKTHGLHPLVF